MNKKVIITADDYGVCDEIDNAIIDGLEAGIITSVAAIVTNDSSVERIKKLVQIQKDMEATHTFGIGLHFCITSGKPLYKINGNLPSSLADPEGAGYFRKVNYYRFRDIEAIDLRQELQLQFSTLEGIVGKGNIDSLSNHHGIVYFDEKMFNEYVQAAAIWAVPIRSPMSWYRKFKKVGDLPDFEGGDLTNPTMRRGVKIGMMRKLGQMSYGSFLKRMNDAEKLKVNYPDVLCEYIYGQCAAEIDQGDKVLAHCLDKFADPDGMHNITQANKFTIKKSSKAKLALVQDKYEKSLSSQDFSIELMFHLAKNSEGVVDMEKSRANTEYHGINLDYFETREKELDCLTQFNWDSFEENHKIEYVPFKAL